MQLNAIDPKVVDQRIRQSLNGRERELYFRLLKRMPPESIVKSIGVGFKKTGAIKDLVKSDVSAVCRQLKENAVLRQRTIGAGIDILTAIKESSTDPKMIYSILFENTQGGIPGRERAVPDWHSIVTLHSTLPIESFIQLDRENLKWLAALSTRQKRYASELEMTNDLLTFILLHGREFIEHLHYCNATFMRCGDCRGRFNYMMNSANHSYSDLEQESEVYDMLIREENDETKLRFVKGIVDVYDSFVTQVIPKVKNKYDNINNKK